MVGGVLTGLAVPSLTGHHPHHCCYVRNCRRRRSRSSYSCPITVSKRWFQIDADVLWINILGFGFSAALIGPIADFLLRIMVEYDHISHIWHNLSDNNYYPIYSTGVSSVGWHPEGYVHLHLRQALLLSGIHSRRNVKTKSLFGLWICYTIGTLSGLMAIGIAKNVGLEVAASAGMASADAST